MSNFSSLQFLVLTIINYFERTFKRTWFFSCLLLVFPHWFCLFMSPVPMPGTLPVFCYPAFSCVLVHVLCSLVVGSFPQFSVSESSYSPCLPCFCAWLSPVTPPSASVFQDTSDLCVYACTKLSTCTEDCPAVESSYRVSTWWEKRTQIYQIHLWKTKTKESVFLFWQQLIWCLKDLKTSLFFSFSVFSLFVSILIFI